MNGYLCISRSTISTAITHTCVPSAANILKIPTTSCVVWLPRTINLTPIYYAPSVNIAKSGSATRTPLGFFFLVSNTGLAHPSLSNDFPKYSSMSYKTNQRLDGNSSSTVDFLPNGSTCTRQQPKVKIQNITTVSDSSLN